MNLLSNLPNWSLFIIFPLASWSVLFLLVSFFRLVSRPLGFEDFDTDVLDTATQNVMSGAYVVLGFVLVLVMSISNDIDNNISKEASQIESLDRLLILDGSPAAQKAHQTLILYTKSIVEDEWDRLSGGEAKPITRKYADTLFEELRAIKASTQERAVLLQNIVRTWDQIAQSRNLRIMNSQSHTPNLFWQLSYLTVLGAITIAALRLLKPSSIRIIALAVQLAMISWLFATVMILDLPYLGQEKISPAAFDRAVRLMESRSF